MHKGLEEKLLAELMCSEEFLSVKLIQLWNVGESGISDKLNWTKETTLEESWNVTLLKQTRGSFTSMGRDHFLSLALPSSPSFPPSLDFSLYLSPPSSLTFVRHLSLPLSVTSLPCGLPLLGFWHMNWESVCVLSPQVSCVCVWVCVCVCVC